MQKMLFTWQKEVVAEDVQQVFGADAFLWGFVVAWSKTENAGDEAFIAGQLKAMNAFDQKHGVAPMGVASGSAMTQSAPAHTNTAKAITTTWAWAWPTRWPQPKLTTPTPAPARLGPATPRIRAVRPIAATARGEEASAREERLALARDQGSALDRGRSATGRASAGITGLGMAGATGSARATESAQATG